MASSVETFYLGDDGFFGAGSEQTAVTSVESVTFRRAWGQAENRSRARTQVRNRNTKVAVTASADLVVEVDDVGLPILQAANDSGAPLEIRICGDAEDKDNTEVVHAKFNIAELELAQPLTEGQTSSFELTYYDEVGGGS